MKFTIKWDELPPEDYEELGQFETKLTVDNEKDLEKAIKYIGKRMSALAIQFLMRGNYKEIARANKLSLIQIINEELSPDDPNIQQEYLRNTNPEEDFYEALKSLQEVALKGYIRTSTFDIIKWHFAKVEKGKYKNGEVPPLS